jgi:hypothetical protein
MGFAHSTNGLLTDQILHQPQHFSRLGVAMQLQLRIDQLSIDRHLKATAIRRHERDRLDQMLIILEQLLCQAHGPIGVMSNRAVNNFNFQHMSSETLGDYIIEAIPARTPAPFHRLDAI